MFHISNFEVPKLKHSFIEQKRIHLLRFICVFNKFFPEVGHCELLHREQVRRREEEGSLHLLLGQKDPRGQPAKYCIFVQLLKSV